MLTALVAASLLSVPPQTSLRDVQACAPTSAGFLVGTKGGLVRLDDVGNQQGVLTELSGLPGTRVHAILITSPQSAWVGTEAGLAKVRIDDHWPRIERVIETQAPVHAIVETPDGLTVGTWGRGVMRVHGSELEAIPHATTLDDAGPLRVADLLWRRDELWVASAGGLWHGTTTLEEQAISLGHPQLWSLAARGDRLTVGGLTGIEHRSLAHLEVPGKVVSTADARDLAWVSGELWAADMDEGLRVKNTKTLPVPALASAQTIGATSQRTCVGTSDGVHVRGKAGWRHVLAEGLPSNDVAALAHDAPADRMWAGTFDQGLAVLENASSPRARWERVELPTLDPQVNVVLPTPNGDTWIGTARGLYRVRDRKGEGKGPRFEVEHFGTKQGLPHRQVHSLTRLRDGRVLVGTTRGAAVIRNDEIESLGRRARAWAVWAAVEGAEDGQLWLGTTQGLIEWRPDGRWLVHSALSDTLPDNWVTSLVRRGETLYVGTYAKGLVRMRKGERGWGAQAIGGGRINPAGLTLVGRTLYLATMEGLLMLDTRSNTPRLRPVPNAAPGRDVTALVVGNGRKWTASRRGIGAF